jgi:hypothetical protein
MSSSSRPGAIKAAGAATHGHREPVCHSGSTAGVANAVSGGGGAEPPGEITWKG